MKKHVDFVFTAYSYLRCWICIEYSSHCSMPITKVCYHQARPV